MPIYDYLCVCGEKFEKYVRYPEKDVIDCPACGKTEVTQQLSLFGFPVPGRAKQGKVDKPHVRDFHHDHHDH